MDESEPPSERTFRRRQALRLLAASAGTATAGSIIVSRPAFADTGSALCPFTFAVDPIALVEYNNNALVDSISIGMSEIVGGCPCGGGATTMYSYFVEVDTGSHAEDWTNLSSVTFEGSFWPEAIGTLTVSVAVQVTCGTGITLTTRCRYKSRTIVIPPAIPDDRFLRLDEDNGAQLPAAGLPACNSV